MTEESFALMTWFFGSSFENPHLVKLVPETQTRGLVIFSRCSALFLIVGGFIALHSAQPPGYAKHLCTASIALLAFALMRRWSRISLPNDVISLALSISGIAYIGTLFVTSLNDVHLFHEAAEKTLVVKAAALITSAIAVLFVTGVIGYYNRCAIIFHAYLASAAVGILPSAAVAGPRSSPLGIVTALVARAAELERAPKP